MAETTGLKGDLDAAVAAEGGHSRFDFLWDFGRELRACLFESRVEQDLEVRQGEEDTAGAFAEDSLVGTAGSLSGQGLEGARANEDVGTGKDQRANRDEIGAAPDDSLSDKLRGGGRNFGVGEREFRFSSECSGVKEIAGGDEEKGGEGHAENAADETRPECRLAGEAHMGPL